MTAARVRAASYVVFVVKFKDPASSLINPLMTDS
jgi:hypothetical protein